MPKRLEINLEPAERAKLERVVKTHPKPYLRERAAAMVKISEGLSGREVALHRLNRPHAPDTIYDWVKLYRQQGLEGLVIKEGRGRACWGWILRIGCGRRVMCRGVALQSGLGVD